nr:hypothetical protein [uncultured Carboxylicivirga sp.]
MIKKITIVLLLATLFIPAIQAQDDYKDTLSLIMPNNVQIDQLVYYKKPENIEVLKEFQSYLKDFLNDFKKLETDGLSEDHPVKFTYKRSSGQFATNSLTFSDYHTPTTILFAKNETDMLNDQSVTNEILIKKRTHLLELVQNEYPFEFKALVHFNNIDQLEELLDYNFEDITNNLETLLAKGKRDSKKRIAFTAFVKIDDNKQPEILQTAFLPGNNDVIQLSAGSGMQGIKGDWLGSFNAQATMILTRKGIDKHAISFSYEWLYNFTTPNEKYINEFIDLGYAHNFSKNPDKDNWMGISFGFMTKRRGEFFSNNTYRLGLNTRLNKNLAIGPQMYFNDFFKDVYPGVNVTITLL